MRQRTSIRSLTMKAVVVTTEAMRGTKDHSGTRVTRSDSASNEEGRGRLTGEEGIGEDSDALKGISLRTANKESAIAQTYA